MLVDKSAPLFETRRELFVELWSRVLLRLEDGEVLITNQDFENVLKSEYKLIVGGQVPPEIEQQIKRAVKSTNTEHPETFIALGVENWIKRTLLEEARRRKWSKAKLEAHGLSTVRRFLRQKSVRDLLHGVGLRGEQLDLFECVRSVIDSLED